MPNQKQITQLPKEIQEHIEHLENMRKDFVANVSHELRTPLTVIHGYLELLAERWQQDPEAANVLELMQKQSLRMQHIIEDLLFLANLEHEHPSKKQFKMIPIVQILHSIAEDAEKLSAGNHTIQLELEDNLPLYGIQNQLQSLFSNLIFNAIKYTPKQGKITIRWFSKNDRAVFQVEDTGIGIPASHIPRITERFYRVDKARSREHGGTGLGLAIAKHVLLNHDAKLLIESKVKKGSLFTCEFPKQPGQIPGKE